MKVSEISLKLGPAVIQIHMRIEISTQEPPKKCLPWTALKATLRFPEHFKRRDEQQMSLL